MKSFFTISMLITLLLGVNIAYAQTMVKDINLSGNGVSTQGIVKSNGRLYFSANNGSTGFELFSSDGTSAGTQLVIDLYPGTSGSEPRDFYAYKTELYFTAQDDIHDRDPYVTQGTSSSTLALMPRLYDPRSTAGYRAYFTDLNRVVYFSVKGGPYGDMGVTDGTPAGTSIALTDIVEGIGNSPKKLETLAGKIYYVANPSLAPYIELWATDGTPAGTQLVQRVSEFSSGPGGYARFSKVELLGEVYFGGLELMKTTGGTATEVKDIESSGNSFPDQLTVFNNQIIFSAYTAGAGRELWISDGTSAGTSLLKNIASGTLDSDPTDFAVFNGKAYFQANDGINGTELWVTDGTPANTLMLKNIASGSSDSEPAGFTEFDGKLYFHANDGAHGRELWVTDGTSGGTQMVKDISPSLNSSNPDDLVVLGGVLYFSADDGSHGRELWKYAGPEDTAHDFSDCPEIKDSGNILPDATPGLIDYLCFHIDIKIIASLKDCIYCRMEPCLVCPSPCLTCDDSFKQFGYAYEVIFSYENQLGEDIKLPVGKQNYFEGIKQNDMGQIEVFEPGDHQNAFSVVAAPGQKVSWVLTDEKGNKRNISYMLPSDLFVKTYPNPNTGVFTLAVQGGNTDKPVASLSIYDDKGKAIKSGTINLPFEEKMDLTKFGKGTYYLKVNQGEYSFTQKIKYE